jgi:hypothetical protein
MRVPDKYQRSANYRTQYINWHPGVFHKYYICAYCGRIVPRDKMEVDHVIPVDKTRKSIFARLLLPDGVNSYRNMVSACHSCNRRKSNKGGMWIVRGIVGKYLQPVVWIVLLCLLAVFFWHFFTVGFSQEQARNVISASFRIFMDYCQRIFASMAHYVSSCFKN